MKKYLDTLKKYGWKLRKSVMQNLFRTHVYRKYHYWKEKRWFSKNYWGADHDDYYIPNGITKENNIDLFTKASFILKLIHSDGAILDLGCGNGLLLKLIVDKSPHHLTPYGVDFMKKSILQAKRLLPEFNSHFITKNVVDFSSEIRFDTIILSLGYEHIMDTRSYLLKCASLLSEEGKLIILNPPDILNRLKARLPILEELLGKRIGLHPFHGIYALIIEKEDTKEWKK